MASDFPAALDSLSNPSSSDKLNSPSHSQQHTNANDAIEALEAKVGITDSEEETSLDFRVDPPVVAHEYGAAIELDRADGKIHDVAVSGNITFTLANMGARKNTMIVRLNYTTSVARTIVWPAGVKWPGGETPSLTCTDGSSDLFGFIRTAADTYDGVFLGFDVKAVA